MAQSDDPKDRLEHKLQVFDIRLKAIEDSLGPLLKSYIAELRALSSTMKEGFAEIGELMDDLVTHVEANVEEIDKNMDKIAKKVEDNLED